jgi:uncharacterized protein YgiM (DUF1202 family)
MRSAQMFGAIGVTLALAGALLAQQGAGNPAPYQAKVGVDDALVRSGPSLSYYPTNKLRRGEVVEVVGEERDGWLKIAPPPDSFSWVQLKHVEKQKESVWVVNETSTKPLIGSTVVSSKPNVEGPPLARGTLLRGLNKTMPDQGETWLRIVPHVSEVRYISVHDVQRIEVADASAPARQPTTVTAIPAVRQTTVEAQTAQSRNSFSPGTYQTVSSAGVSSTVGSQPWCYNPTSQAAQLCVPAPVQTLQPVSAPTGVSPQWSGVGKLLPSGFYIDGKRAYRLEDQYKRLVLYVTPGSNVDLEPLVYRNVDLHGPLCYRGEYKANCMNADTVVPAP